MMKSRKLGIGLLLMLAIVVTTGTFAYWASSVSGNSADVSKTVTIGQGGVVTTTVTLGATTGSGADLVPDGRTGDHDVEWTIPVEWDACHADGYGVTGDLEVTVVYSISPGTLTDTQLDEMFSFGVTGDGAITEGAAAQNVILTLTFDTEPASKLIYDEVQNGNLTVTITFTVTPTP